MKQPDYAPRSKRRRKTRTYKTPLPTKQLLFLVALFVFSALFAFGAFRLFSYIKEGVASRRAAEAIRQVYYATTKEPAPTEAIGQFTATPAPSPAADEATADPDILPQMRYPGNPYAIVTSRFRELRKTNEDIIGWLTVADQLDQAVVLKDNSAYLTTDYMGNANKNGAIFLDENCDVTSRPYTYVLYGHNMKSGAMFGSLREYEDLSCLTQYPFITFDTAYEAGRYVVFAVGTVSTDPDSWQYLDLTRLCAPMRSLRDEAIRKLKALSVFDCPLEVRDDDQVLVLMTCSDGSDERRVVAARRIRNNESDATLQSILSRTRTK